LEKRQFTRSRTGTLRWSLQSIACAVGSTAQPILSLWVFDLLVTFEWRMPEP